MEELGKDERVGRGGGALDKVGGGAWGGCRLGQREEGLLDVKMELLALSLILLRLRTVDG